VKRERTSTRLLDLRDVETQYGIPYGTSYDLVKRGVLRSVSIPGVRRIFVAREDLDRAIESWKETP
jgi:hypothetical protein